MGRIVSSQIVRPNDVDPPRLNNIAGNSATAVASAPRVFYSAEFIQNGAGANGLQLGRTISSKNVSNITIEYLPQTFFPGFYNPEDIGYQVTINFQIPFDNTDYVPIVMGGGTFATNTPEPGGPRFNSQFIGQEYAFQRSGPSNVYQKRTTILGAGNEIKQTTSFTIMGYSAELSSLGGGGEE